MSIIMLREKGKRIPNKLLDLACEKASNGFGLMYSGKDGFQILNSDIKNANDPQEVSKFLNEVLVKEKIIIHLRSGSMESDIQDNIQPFIVVEKEVKNAKNTPLVGVALVGTFSDYERQGKYSPSYIFNEKVLMPLLSKYEFAVGAANVLDQPELMYLLGHQLENKGCMIVLMDHTGKILKVSKPDHVTYKAFDFGWSSDHCGFKPEQTVVQSRILTEQSGIILPNSNTGKQKELLNSSGDVIMSTMKVAPPSGLAQSQLKEWYRDNNAEKDPRTGLGLVPKDWRSKPQVTVKSVSKSNTQTTKTPKEADNIPGVASVAKDSVSTQMKTAHFSEKTPKGSTWHKPGIADVPVKEVEAIKGWASEKGKKTPPPQTGEMFDQKTPTFSELTGINIEETFGWGREGVVEICKQWPSIAAELLMELQDLYGKALKDIDELTAPDDGKFEDKVEKTKTDVKEKPVEKVVEGKKPYVPSWKRHKAA